LFVELFVPVVGATSSEGCLAFLLILLVFSCYHRPLLLLRPPENYFLPLDSCWMIEKDRMNIRASQYHRKPSSLSWTSCLQSVS